MQFTIRLSSSVRSDLGNHRFEEVLTRSLDRFRHRLKKVFVFIHDVNGPRGGVDKQCRCVLHLKRMPPVVIQDQDESVTSLIHRVANRASYALSEKVDRRNKRVLQNRRARRKNAYFDKEFAEAGTTATLPATGY